VNSPNSATSPILIGGMCLNNTYIDVKDNDYDVSTLLLYFCYRIFALGQSDVILVAHRQIHFANSFAMGLMFVGPLDTHHCKIPALDEVSLLHSPSNT
jgi:hypothetical protein